MRVLRQGVPHTDELRFYPDNKIALKFYFDDADPYDVTAPPAHGPTQRTTMIEFEGSMLVTTTWTFDITLFNGPALEHAGTESITYTRRDGGVAFGFDVSLDDDAVIMPLDLVLPQLPRSCVNGGMGGPDPDDPNSGGGGGGGRPPPRGDPPPPPAGRDQAAGRGAGVTPPPPPSPP